METTASASARCGAYKTARISIALLAVSATVWAQDDDDSFAAPPSVPVLPAIETLSPAAAPKQEGVQWKPLINSAFRLLAIEHIFRYSTEPGTRSPGQPFFRGYVDSVGALHGWADGDPFYVNYVGHPMQGAVSGYIWTLNDGRFRNVEFGKNPEYWKGRIRAGAFAWAYSEQMEIGPLSEASFGNVQAFPPQQGLVDHVVTPAIGLGWIIAEDALDEYLVRFVERKTHNRTLRALVRGSAKPSRSLANVVSGKWPWARPRDAGGEAVSAVRNKVPRDRGNTRPKPGVAPFEFVA